jgi:hypothetical protein
MNPKEVFDVTFFREEESIMISKFCDEVINYGITVGPKMQQSWM